MEYDYLYFEKKISSQKQFSSTDLIFFKRLPLHHKEQLFSFSCTEENLEVAKLIQRSCNVSNNMDKIVTNIICHFPQKKIDTLKWLLSFNVFPSLNNDIKYMMKNQSIDIWELVFPYMPLNEHKVYQLISTCITNSLDDALNWIMDKQYEKKLVFHHDMYYWGIYQCFCLNHRQLGVKFLDRIVQYFPNDLIQIKQKMLKKLYVLTRLTNLSINNSEQFVSYFRDVETECLYIKINNSIPNNNQHQEKEKRIKI